ncbi:MAG: oligoendopeptidase F [Clostridiales Family XIII bacterium]|jgi:oligoendopeptidase F|nr:oligoendopeptidase F [Clostridiales Family XIII bacterium]
MTKQRSEIASKYKWNMRAMYKDQAEWEADYARALTLAEDYGKFSGKLGQDAKTLLAAFKAADAVWQVTEKVFVYARMRRDEDNRVAKYQVLSDRAQALIAKVGAALSFFTPEFLAIPRKKLDEFMTTGKGLKQYAYTVQVLLREKAHVLKKDQEHLMAQLGEVLGSTNEVFSMFNNADLRFGNIKDEKGVSTELTHGNYIRFMESPNRFVRRSAYEKMYAAYGAHINTLAVNYAYNTKVDVVTSRIRGYKSSLVRALSADNVPESVYDNLIRIVNENLGSLHRYMDLRRRILKVGKLKMYDVYVPLYSLKKDKTDFSQAVKLMKQGLAPLGKEYISRLSDGVKAGWIDVFENVGKTSGAYSFGSYDSMPYVLMNFSGKLKDVFTLVHEMGHSMHALYTRETQPFRYGGHSIFTAEVASTVNESLLMHHLLETRKSKAEQRYFINLYLEEFRTTLFRQTMFAEFERYTHAEAEAGVPLTAAALSDAYGKLNAKYFGPCVETDAQISMEWARIPHFYRAFYVYKYATGYSAATAIADRILTQGAPAAEKYIRFLKTGESADPIDLLQIAGVDMSRPEPVENAMQVFSGLVDKLEQLI